MMTMKSKEKVGGGEEERNILSPQRNKTYGGTVRGCLPVLQVNGEGASSFMLFGLVGNTAPVTQCPYHHEPEYL